MGLDFSPMEQLAPIVPIVIAIGSPLVPLAIHPLVPLAMVIANGANGDHHWSQWRSPLAANGANKMAPMANCTGDSKSCITIGDRRNHHWRKWR